MRLLNATTFELALFSDDQIPPYAILSHTWAEEEASFESLSGVGAAAAAGVASRARQPRGWAKITQSCAAARALGLDYIWVDTCCIDKGSSAELSEAINSMFRWYRQASVCIAYLADVFGVDVDGVADGEDTTRRGGSGGGRGVCFKRSRWFTRGWTLQELIAPCEVLFYGADWASLGTRASLRKLIKEATGIPEQLLAAARGGDAAAVDAFSVAQRMSWAAARVTTRPEDVAYCLLGLFDINMPLLYGEGPAKAFKRLQEEIIKSTDDESLYAWRCGPQSLPGRCFWGLLAESPAAFGNYGHLLPVRSRYLSRRRARKTVTVTNRGLTLDLSLTPFPNDRSGTIYLAFLDCDVRREGSTSTLVPAILLQRIAWDSDADFTRIRPDILALSMMNVIVLPDEISLKMGLGPGDQSAAVAEPKAQQISIPHKCTAALPPSGILFDPQVHHTGNMPDQVTVEVTSRSPTWQYFASPTLPNSNELYEINFNLVSVPDVDHLVAPVVFGVLELDISTASADDDGCCLVAGLEPTEPNPFNTQALYFVPWCAFESRRSVVDSSFKHVMDKASRQGREHFVLSHGRRLVATFELDTKYSRLFYRLKISVADGEVVRQRRDRVTAG
ncbi:hypothetical protein JDV02_001519 [Purpureocillium takamizusanense]|uniref:HET-domain-containing protein n=1 Tax=Purpureocillium takamizusanense TaxID=2060973 RepID=A0A9Q8V7M2_9HYPO|nr:uncharacterized protein JDV02_001519 [Purpureocillium takamizusanense]UNI14942.1 hypothetical protein JDV02_001519 [Purpureocillium takamizusanense]